MRNPAGTHAAPAFTTTTRAGRVGVGSFDNDMFWRDPAANRHDVRIISRV